MKLIKRLFYTYKLTKEIDNMATIYTTLIVMGHKHYYEVPHTLKEQVRVQLIQLEAEHLITE